MAGEVDVVLVDRLLSSQAFALISFSILYISLSLSLSLPSVYALLVAFLVGSTSQPNVYVQTLWRTAGASKI